MNTKETRLIPREDNRGELSIVEDICKITYVVVYVYEPLIILLSTFWWWHTCKFNSSQLRILKLYDYVWTNSGKLKLSHVVFQENTDFKYLVALKYVTKAWKHPPI